MSLWTIQYIDGASVTQEVTFPALAALESGQVIADGWQAHFQSHKASTLSLRLPGVPAHIAPAIPFESPVKIYSDRVLTGGVFSDGVKRFEGRRTDRSGLSDPRRSSSSYVFSDAWYDLEHLPFYQQWTRVTDYTTGATTTYPFTNIVLFQPNPGQVYAPVPVAGRIHTGQQIVDILNWAIAQGVNLQIGTIDPASYVASYPVQNVKCAAALRMCLRVHPDCFCEIDYETTPPTFHVRRRANLTSVTLPYEYTDSSGRRHQATDIQARPELRPRRVALLYRVIADGALVSAPSDIYPVGATTGLRALDFAIDLQGPRLSVINATVTSTAFDPTNLLWWRKKHPALKDATHNGQIPDSGPGALTLLDSTVNGGSNPKGITVVDEAGVAIDLGTFGYELDPRSSVMSWMTSVQVKWATVTAFFKYKKSSVIGGATISSEIKEHRHHVRIKLTNTPTTSFRYSQYLTTGEAVPANLAQDIYTALNMLQYNLTHKLVEKPFNGWLKPGKHAVNLAGGATEWATMNTPIQSTDYRMHLDGSGTAFDNFEVKCGPVEHLEAGELVQLFNLFANRDLSKMEASERSSGNPNLGQSVDMPGDTAQENSTASDPVFSFHTIYAPDASDSTRSIAILQDASTGQLSVVQRKTSDGTDYTSGIIAAQYTGAGAPSSATLATSAYYRLRDRYFDASNKIEYICTTAGDKTASAWAPLGGVVAGTGFNWRGAWTATPATPYMTNDAVLLGIGSTAGIYLSLINTNTNAPSSGLGWAQISSYSTWL